MRKGNKMTEKQIEATKRSNRLTQQQINRKMIKRLQKGTRDESKGPKANL